ncbi:type III-B CRISPR module-associated protein Cmr5 [Thermoflavimicrobium daqui]|jgi:CRISPR-associated protein Cmr5|uniref:CRISPR type III-B/RAMP module-associated protein Cmr5 n=1 Tax=Thermoflavimicrobium daqui TaxID=2137476 RepID=A0A364K5P8_9BACL|nr:type III-B CRISPR module-associated protein Cmr5 [Thermoflavimicrobium daqui]RAL25613.1 type III-B CRISPR module-associated protein Cmr5 [Thermoflavimicrobium daqui]
MVDQTLDQQRAADALDKVKDIENNQAKQLGDDYASYVTSLPADILINGLGQALAQLIAAAKRSKNDPHLWLYENIQHWILHRSPLAKKLNPDQKSLDLIQVIMNHDRQTYQHIQAEIIAWLEWHKKLATAYLKQPESEQA